MVKERWNIFNIQLMRAIDPPYDEEIIPQIHVSLEALKKDLAEEWTFGPLDYTGTPKVKQTAKFVKTDRKTCFSFCNSGGEHGQSDPELRQFTTVRTNSYAFIL